MTTVWRYLRLWWRFVLLALGRETAYRTNFLFSVVEGLAQLGLALVAFGLLYHYTTVIRGWDANEALLLLGVYRAMDGLLALQIAPNMMRLPRDVARGNLDSLLLRPVASDFLVSLRVLDAPEAVNVVIGMGLVLFAAHREGLHIGVGAAVEAVVLAMCGLVALSCFWLCLVTCAVWLVRVEPLGYLFYDVWQTARYPVTYFRGAMRSLLTFVVPVAFATTFPAQALIGAIDIRLLPVGVGMALLALLATRGFWRFALRWYTSAGG